MKALFNAHLVPMESVPFTAFSRLRYGDGFFETLRYTQGRIPLHPWHVKRMQKAATALGLHLPDWIVTATLFQNQIDDLLVENAIGSDALLRLTISRASGRAWGSTSSEINAVVECEALSANHQKTVNQVLFYRVEQAESMVWKGPLQPVYNEAFSYALQQGAADVLLIDEEGSVIDGGISTPVLYLDDTWVCPPLGKGIASVSLQKLLDKKVRIKPKPLGKKDVLLSEKLILLNAVRGARYVLQLGDEKHFASAQKTIASWNNTLWYE